MSMAPVNPPANRVTQALAPGRPLWMVNGGGASPLQVAKKCRAMNSYTPFFTWFQLLRYK